MHTYTNIHARTTAGATNEDRTTGVIWPVHSSEFSVYVILMDCDAANQPIRRLSHAFASASVLPLLPPLFALSGGSAVCAPRGAPPRRAAAHAQAHRPCAPAAPPPAAAAVATRLPCHTTRATLPSHPFARVGSPSDAALFYRYVAANAGLVARRPLLG
eukprot:6211970-Pleurochrysis_carterae.AAC.4